MWCYTGSHSTKCGLSAASGCMRLAIFEVELGRL